MDCETTDTVWIRLVARTDEAAAWDGFNRLHRPPILARCRGVGLNCDPADGVVQECFIQCLRYLPSFEHDVAVGRFRDGLDLQMIRLEPVPVGPAPAGRWVLADEDLPVQLI